MRVALDTNILVYAEGVNGAAMQQSALDLIGRLPQGDVFLSVQVLGELFHVLTRKAVRPRAEALAAIWSWRDTFALLDTTAAVMVAAIDLALRHRLVVWDCVILSAAAESGCRVVLSQDMQDGFAWRGVTVVNPFAAPHHPLLEALLAEDRPP